MKVLLLGETCKDEYHFGECNRLSPEAPVPIFEYKYELLKLGMAKNVKDNLESFGCSVNIFTNNENYLIKRRLIDIKSNTQLLREDFGNVVPKIKIPEIDYYDLILISDYNKGLMDYDSIKEICKKFKGLIFVDTKKKDLSCFSNCIIKCNATEYEQIIKMPIDSQIIITKGKEGAEWNGNTYPAPKVEIHDVTGAGDVFLASLSVCYFITRDIETSIKKSIKLATESTKHFGIYKLTQDDIYAICD